MQALQIRRKPRRAASTNTGSTRSGGAFVVPDHAAYCQIETAPRCSQGRSSLVLRSGFEGLEELSKSRVHPIRAASRRRN